MSVLGSPTSPDHKYEYSGSHVIIGVVTVEIHVHFMTTGVAAGTNVFMRNVKVAMTMRSLNLDEGRDSI